MTVLEKCEQALHKLNSTATSSSHGHMCQPMLDVVARFTTAPSLNHSLYRTFGPALEAYTGPAIRAPSPPPAKMRKVEQDSPEELPDVIQGEIARLGRRFQVSVDPKYHPGSEAYHLVCRLEESQLPSVPPLLVKLPKMYPRASPQCDPDACSGYDVKATDPQLDQLDLNRGRKVLADLRVRVQALPRIVNFSFSLCKQPSTWYLLAIKARAGVFSGLKNLMTRFSEICRWYTGVRYFDIFPYH
ncbi:hypothetical protein RRG08_045597 [Elysia crispata]|uniref:Mediator of RNA polymerase II transcription subunit 15 n=1 Tax=Elysia crispata TaxID=231223 RepID=A0AAE1ACI5_9GAST|nr:hypothetical protein RRG08_045597 [Elysia crispata]